MKQKKEKKPITTRDECDGCEKIKEVTKCGEYNYCKECLEEVDKGN